LALLLLLSFPSGPALAATIEELRQAANAILNRSTVSANTWSILVESLDGSVVYYERNPGTPMRPASNTKLFVTSAAYELLGWNHLWNGTRIIDAIADINKPSDNALADSLLIYLGQVRRGSATSAAGAAETLAWCSGTLGINMTGAIMNDGSGLNRGNRFSARQTVQLLRHMVTAYTSYDDSLPIGCVDGTISGRFCGTVGSGNVHAKTGTLIDTIALSGYIDNPNDGRRYLFSFMANNVSNQTATRQAIDDCVILWGRAAIPQTPEFEGIIVDNADPLPAYLESGAWSASATSGSWNGGARFASLAGVPLTQVARFAPVLPRAGVYRVYQWHTAGTNRSVAAQWQVVHRDGVASPVINQQANGATWMPLGEFDFNPGGGASVTLLPAASSTASGGTVVMADAVQFVWIANPRAISPARPAGWALY